MSGVGAAPEAVVARIRWSRGLLAFFLLGGSVAGILAAVYLSAAGMVAMRAPSWVVTLRVVFVAPPLVLFAVVWAYLDSVPRVLRPGALLMTSGLSLWMAYELLVVWVGVPRSGAVVETVLGGVVVAGMVADLYGALVESRSARVQAESDPLTGLWNRAGALRAWERIAPGTDAVVAVVDLNELKTTNDALGHAAGDRLLLSCAAGLRGACGDRGWAARWGGDEFLAVLPGLGEHDARSLLNAAEGKVAAAVGDLPVWAVGVVAVSADLPLREALQAADARMYREKALQYRLAERPAERRAGAGWQGQGA